MLPTTTPRERLEKTRQLVRDRAYEGQDYYVALRDSGDTLKVGFASMGFAERTGSLSSALYYEVWAPDGTITNARYNNAARLIELGGAELPLSLRPFHDTGLVTVRTCLHNSDYNLQIPPTLSVGVQGQNATLLWWEVERAEKARKLDELVNMRRELRAMLNYD